MLIVDQYVDQAAGCINVTPLPSKQNPNPSMSTVCSDCPVEIDAYSTFSIQAGFKRSGGPKQTAACDQTFAFPPDMKAIWFKDNCIRDESGKVEILSQGLSQSDMYVGQTVVIQLPPGLKVSGSDSGATYPCCGTPGHPGSLNPYQRQAAACSNKAQIDSQNAEEIVSLADPLALDGFPDAEA